MGEERMWFYMDSTGQEFGPYPSSTMRGWFRQNFFPMQGELQVRLEEMPSDQHYYIKDLYPHPIMDRAFDGEPNLPSDGRTRGARNRAGGGGGGGGGGARNAAPPMMSMENPYDMGLGAGAALWAGMPGMPGMMGAGAMQSPGMAPFGFPPMRPGMIPGMPGMGMPMMPGPGAATGRFSGRIKSFNVQKGFGFIDCAEAHQIYGRDVFLHKAQIANFQIGSQLSFAVEMNKNNMPQARDLLETDMMGGFPGGPMGGMGFPGMGAPSGKGGYNNPKGGGGGKGKAGGGKNNKPKGGGAKAAEQKKPGAVVGDKKPPGGGSKNEQAPPGPGPADVA